MREGARPGAGRGESWGGRRESHEREPRVPFPECRTVGIIQYAAFVLLTGFFLLAICVKVLLCLFVAG